MTSKRNVAVTTAPITTRKRCAVYTRKSTDEGLDQEYNSLDAQRDAGLAYIASQRSEGWVLVEDGYDDGGFSGGNLDRPALKRLMADIEARLTA
jgi:site-specific DNA recombinase